MDFSELIEFAIYDRMTKDDIIIIWENASIQYLGDELKEIRIRKSIYLRLYSVDESFI